MLSVFKKNVKGKGSRSLELDIECGSNMPAQVTDAFIKEVEFYRRTHEKSLFDRLPAFIAAPRSDSKGYTDTFRLWISHKLFVNTDSIVQ